jgi:hypothetical protein
MTEPVHKLFSEPQPGPQADDVNATYVQVARSIASICATRMLLMIAVITGSAIWGFTAWDPQRERLYAAIAFSLVFVVPQVLLFWKRG